MESLREQVYKILNNNSLRNNLIQKGQNRVEDFSWEMSAQKTLDIYNSVIH
jgi:glycosyltransferase involved in cell wall biosynthesis